VVTRPLLTTVAQKLYKCKHGVLRRERVFILEHCFGSESFAADREAYSNVYPDKDLQNKIKCEILGSHGGEYEDDSLLGYSAETTRRYISGSCHIQNKNTSIIKNSGHRNFLRQATSALKLICKFFLTNKNKNNSFVLLF
jgi:hypothetical protein